MKAQLDLGINGLLAYWVVAFAFNPPSLLAAAPSPTNLIDDLRLLQAPKPLPVVWQIVILVAALGLIGLLLWRRAVARRGAGPTAAGIAEAREDALAELEKLRGLISTENSRTYAIQVSGVVRRYIERRFAIHAPKRSTEEFLLEAQGSGRLDERHRKNLTQFLAACDFLKFAKATAEVKELKLIHEGAVRFVTDTQEEAPAAQAGAKTNPIPAKAGAPNEIPAKAGAPNEKPATKEAK
jgi:hypothetical protein